MARKRITALESREDQEPAASLSLSLSLSRASILAFEQVSSTRPDSIVPQHMPNWLVNHNTLTCMRIFEVIGNNIIRYVRQSMTSHRTYIKTLYLMINANYNNSDLP